VNWTERTFLGLVLLVGAGVILVTLSAVGVHIPYLSAARTEIGSEETMWDDVPAPLVPPEEQESGLLAELRDGPGFRGIGAPGAVAGSTPAGIGDLPGAAGATAPGAGDEGAEDDASGARKPRDPLIDKLKATIDAKDPGALIAFLAAMTTPKGTKLSEEDLEYLFAALGEHEDFGLRNLLLMHLERIGGDGVTKGVLAFLAEEKNPAAIQRALATLGAQNDDASVAGLVAYMESAKNRRLREAAFQNLLRTKNASATDALLDILDHSQDRGLTRYALAAASQLGGQAGAEAVLRFASSSDPYERSIGLKSLRDVRSRDAVPALSQAVAGGSNTYVRQQAMRALARIRDPRSIATVSTVAANDPNRGLRHEAIRTLGSIGRSEAIPTLQSIAANDTNASIRRNAEKAITSIQKQEERRARRAAR